MRRVLPVAFLGALLTVAPAVWGQHGAVGQSGGIGGGHVGGFSSHSFSGPGRIGGVAPHSFGAPGRAFATPGRIIGPSPRIASTLPGRSFAPHDQHTPAWAGSGYRYPGYGSGRGRWGNHDHHGDHDHHRAPYPGYGYGYGFGGYPYGTWANSWELLPGDLGDQDFTGEDNSGYTDQDSNTAQAQPPADQQQPAEPEPPDSGAYAPGYPMYAWPAYPYPANPGAAWAAPAQPSSDPVAPEPELRLIFRDGHQQAIRNYVLTPTSVIVMNEAASGRPQQIPLAALNLPATEQAAQQAGLEFRPPSPPR